MDEFKEQVYLTLTGTLLPKYGVPGVEDAFADGSFCMECYRKAMDAYASLRSRLGVEDEDQDMETIINNFMDIQWYIGLKMYMYGAEFGNKLEQEE